MSMTADRRPVLALALLLGARAALSESELCSGIEKRFPRSGSVVCCPTGCGQCGGSKCASAPVPNPQSSCCPGPIVRKGEMCRAGSAGPCVVKKPGDPTCANNILADDGTHCCPKACGVCGGDGCADAPGGKKACCLPSRRKAGDARSCSKVDPPCVITPAPGASRRGALRGAGVVGSARSGGGAAAAAAATGPPAADGHWGWLFILILGVAAVALCGGMFYLANSG